MKLTKKATKRLKEIEADLKVLPLGNYDVWPELLYERHILMGGDPNILDKDLLDDYFAPLIKAIEDAT